MTLQRRSLARTRVALAGAAATVAMCAASAASAHDFNPGVLALHERAAETGTAWDVAWTAPVDSRGDAAAISVRWPAGCALTGPLAARALLTCDDALTGELAFEGLYDPTMLLVVAVRARHGDHREHLVRGASPTVVLAAESAVVDAREERSLTAWIGVGIEHIAFGIDHVAFVLGLLLLLRPRLVVRGGAPASGIARVLATLTAFTIAHSVTLALAALDVVALSSAPVEACIALSVVLVAREALRDDDTAMRRWPWLVAGVFGLVHGLGFAGALEEVGLPKDALAASLLGFNVGVELGQLAIVVVALAGAAAVARVAAATRFPLAQAHRAAATALGALAAWWLIERVVAIAA